MAVREGPTGAVEHLELAFPSANDRITLTRTQPAAPPIELYSPSGASAACP
jgi:hypothetical protein